MTTYYVSTTGNDANSGSTTGSPWATLQWAVDHTNPGDIIQLRTGTHAGATLNVGASGGSISTPLVIENYPGEAAVVSGVSGSRRNTIWVTGASYVQIRKNAAGGSFTVNGAQGSTVSASDAPANIRIEDATSIIIDGLVITAPATGTWANGDAKGGFGVYAENSITTVKNCDISHCGSGVRYFNIAGESWITDNEIHHCDRMLNNTGSGDTGAQGIAVRETLRTNGWTRVLRNYVHDCIARSVEFGFDGGGCELYKAANVEIAYNDFADTKVASESGTGSGRYDDIGPYYYHHNRIWRKVGGATGVDNGSTDIMSGINMRCGDGNIVANNSFYRMNNWGCILVNHTTATSGFGSTTNNARILNNANTSSVFFIQIQSQASDLVCDYNISDPGSSYGKYHGTTYSSLSAWQAATVYDDHSLDADVLYTSPPSDFTLQSSSPAIDAGTTITGITDGYVAPAPDMGAWEFGVADPGGDPGSGTIYSSDAFGDAASNGWGNDDQGNAWAIIEGTSTNFSVSGGIARRSNMTGASNAATAARAISQIPVEAKAKMHFNSATTSALSQQGILLRHNGTTTAYRAMARIQTNGNIDLRLESWVVGVNTAIGSDATALLTGQDGTTPIWVKFQVSGTSPTTLKAKLWADGTAEPAAWQLNTTDSTAGLQVAGGAGVRGFLGAAYSGATNEWQVDDWQAKDLGASTALTSYIVGAGFPRGSAVVGATTGTDVPDVYDFFDRDVSTGGWGNTTSGQPWTVTPSGQFYTIFGDGYMIAAASPNNDLVAELQTVSLSDARLQGNFRSDKLPAGASQQRGMRFRAQASGDFYRAVVRHKTDNKLYVNLTKRIGGVSTDLSADVDTGFTVAATGVLISLKADIIGTTLRVKAWPETVAEPGWQLTTTDSAITAPGFMAVTGLMATGTTNYPIETSWEDVFAGALLPEVGAYVDGTARPRGLVVATSTATPRRYVFGSGAADGFVEVGAVTGSSVPGVPVTTVLLGGLDISNRVAADAGNTVLSYGRGANFDGAQEAPGHAVVSVKNNDKAFNPLNGSSPYNAVLKLGTPLHVSVAYGGVSYPIFDGFLRRIVPVDDKFAELHCEDALFNFSRRSANVAASVTRSLKQFRDAILDDIGEGSARRSLDSSAANGAEGVVTYTGADDANALDLLTQLNIATGTVHFVRPTASSYQYVTIDRLTLQSRASVDTWSDSDLTQPFAETLGAYDLTDERIDNYQRVEARPRLLDDDASTVWTRDRLQVGPSLTRVRWPSFDDPTFFQSLSYDVESGSATVTFRGFARSAKVTVDAGAGGVVLKHLKIVGRVARLAELDASISEDAASQTANGVLKGSTISSDYISSEVYADALGGWYVYRYATPRATASPTFVNRFPTVLLREVGDRIVYSTTEHSLSAREFLIRSFETTVSEREWRTTYQLEEVPTAVASLFTIGGTAAQGVGGTGILGY